MATGRACEDAMHTSLPGSQQLSSNVGSPNGSSHDFEGMGHRLIDAFCYHSRVDSQILTTTSRPSVKPWAWSPPELPVLNRLSMPSLPRWRCLQRWNKISAPSLHVCARSRHMQPHHQMYPVRHGLGLESNMLACNKLVRIHCKAGSVSVRPVFETRSKCQDFGVRFQDDGIPYAIYSPFCCANSTITVRQSRSIEDRAIGKQFAPLWRDLADQLRILFPDGNDEGVFVLPALDARSQTLSIKDRRTGIGKPVFKLAPLGTGQTFTSCCT